VGIVYIVAKEGPSHYMSSRGVNDVDHCDDLKENSAFVEHVHGSIFKTVSVELIHNI